MAKDDARVKEILHEALERPAAEHASYLDEACGVDMALRARVEALLREIIKSPGFMDAPTRSQALVDLGGDLTEGPGTMIGPYKLLQLIGEGGFGQVYMAEQSEPVKRRVALKIIKLGMDTRQVIARFEAERQALAMMDHPNIARVFDAGATDTGRPYFVMELVKGIPITRYCDDSRLTTRERLELFRQVCRAVQHAHQKGVIHRDIKPSNVLIALHDGEPVPKVIDFGIAKATSARLTERTLFTEFRQVIGTPAYMSPEQASFSALDVDARTDVYSLGVLLYELLTGAPPFDDRRLREAGLAEMERIIRDEEPPRPSTRLSTLGKALGDVAQRRREEAGKLGRLVRGDLDWIVMRTLEKDRNRRYETPSALADDIQRYLKLEPVEATPPSAGYKLRKFVRRNKGLVTAGAVVATVLILGVIGTTSGLIWALDERARAEDEADRARRRQVQAELVSNFTGRILAGVEPAVALGRDTTMLMEMVDDAAVRLADEDLREAPEAEFEVRTWLAGAYMELAEFDKASEMLQPGESLLEQIEDPSSSRRELLLNLQGTLDWRRGHHEQAARRFREGIEIIERQSPPDQYRFGQALSNLAAVLANLGQVQESEQVHERGIELLESHLDDLKGQDHQDREIRSTRGLLATAYDNLARLHIEQSRFHEALPILQNAIELARTNEPDGSPLVASILNELGALYQYLEQDDEAEKAYIECYEIRRRMLPEDHDATATSLHNLATFYLTEQRAEEAEQYMRLAMEMRERLFPGANLSVARSYGAYASILEELGRIEEALPYAEKSIEMKRQLGDDPAEVGLSMSQLAEVLIKQKEYEKADAMYLEAIELLEQAYPEPNERLVRCYNNYGYFLKRWGRTTDAIPFYEMAVDQRRLIYGGDHRRLALTIWNLGRAYQDIRDWPNMDRYMEEAIDMLLRLDDETDIINGASSAYWWARNLKARGELDRALVQYERAINVIDGLGKLSERTAPVISSYGVLLRELGRMEESEIQQRRAIELLESNNAVNRDYAFALQNLATLLKALERYDEAEQYSRKALAVLQELYGEHHRDVAQQLEYLGVLLVSAGKYREGFETLKEQLEVDRQLAPDDTAAAVTGIRKVATYIADKPLGSELCHDVEVLARDGLRRWEELPPDGRDTTIGCALRLALVRVLLMPAQESIDLPQRERLAEAEELLLSVRAELQRRGDQDLQEALGETQTLFDQVSSAMLQGADIESP